MPHWSVCSTQRKRNGQPGTDWTGGFGVIWVQLVYVSVVSKIDCCRGSFVFCWYRKCIWLHFRVFFADHVYTTTNPSLRQFKLYSVLVYSMKKCLYFSWSLLGACRARFMYLWGLCMCVCVCACVCICVSCVIWERERDKESERESFNQSSLSYISYLM